MMTVHVKLRLHHRYQLRILHDPTEHTLDDDVSIFKECFHCPLPSVSPPHRNPVKLEHLFFDPSVLKRAHSIRRRICRQTSFSEPPPTPLFSPQLRNCFSLHLPQPTQQFLLLHPACLQFETARDVTQVPVTNLLKIRPLQNLQLALQVTTRAPDP